MHGTRIVKILFSLAVLLCPAASRVRASDASALPEETRVLIVCFPGETTDTILAHYQKARHIPDSHVLFITGAACGDAFWPSTYDNFVRPLREKLDSLGPESIHYIVLINAPRLTDYGGEKVSTVTFAMCAYNLKEKPEDFDKSNPCYRPGRLFKDPMPRFSHEVYSRDGYFYIVSCFEGERAIAQIERGLLPASEGYHIIDSRLGPYDERPAAYFDLDKYPYVPGFDYSAMDLKHVAVVKWFESRDKDDYLWHYQEHVYGAGDEPVVKTKSWVGWYDNTYYGKFDWQPQSYWSQVHSGNAAAMTAWEQGCTFVTAPLFEPLTWGVPQPTELSYYIHSGYTYGEAVMYSLPRLMWAAWVCGDPLITQTRTER